MIDSSDSQFDLQTANTHIRASNELRKYFARRVLIDSGLLDEDLIRQFLNSVSLSGNAVFEFQTLGALEKDGLYVGKRNLHGFDMGILMNKTLLMIQVSRHSGKKARQDLQRCAFSVSRTLSGISAIYFMYATCSKLTAQQLHTKNLYQIPVIYLSNPK